MKKATKLKVRVVNPPSNEKAKKMIEDLNKIIKIQFNSNVENCRKEAI